MGFEMFWYYQPRIVQVIAHGELTTADIEKMHRQLVEQYLNGSKQPVHLILDVRAVTNLPIRDGQATALFEQMIHHRSFGRFIVIRADNPVQFFIMSSISQIIGFRFHQVRSIGAAAVLLQGYDASLYKLAM